MNVCPNCFIDIELKSFIEFNSESIGICDFCSSNENENLINHVEILDFFSEIFSLFVINVDGEKLVDVLSRDWKLFSDDVNKEKLVEQLTFLDSRNPLEANSIVTYDNEIVECIAYWEFLKNGLMWERRFHTNIDEIIDYGWDSYFNKTITLPENTTLFRARLHHHASEDKYPVDRMGCPPRNKVSSGRANPEGIPFLYLSKSPETTLYEIRSSFLDELSIGEFKIQSGNDIVLVDFIESDGPFLNIGRLDDYIKEILLKVLISQDLSKPKRRYDSELDYIPTQYICEFIKYITNADGILFKSSLHTDGQNIVLFDENKMYCSNVKKHKVIGVAISSIEI